MISCEEGMRNGGTSGSSWTDVPIGHLALWMLAFVWLLRSDEDSNLILQHLVDVGRSQISPWLSASYLCKWYCDDYSRARCRAQAPPTDDPSLSMHMAVSNKSIALVMPGS